MASLTQAMQVANNPTFQSRVLYAMTLAATNVMAEVNTVTGHTLRVTYAKTVLGGTASVLLYAVAAVTNSTITAEINLGAADFGVPDGDIQFAVNSVFSAFAGVST